MIADCPVLVRYTHSLYTRLPEPTLYTHSLYTRLPEEFQIRSSIQIITITMGDFFLKNTEIIDADNIHYELYTLTIHIHTYTFTEGGWV